MKIRIITDEEFQRLRSNLTDEDLWHFEYGLFRVPIFGREFIVDDEVRIRKSWRNEPFMEYRIRVSDGYRGYHWRIPEWLVADINNDDEEV